MSKISKATLPPGHDACVGTMYSMYVRTLASPIYSLAALSRSDSRSAMGSDV